MPPDGPLQTVCLAADIPGMVPTKGRMLDHPGFEPRPRRRKCAIMLAGDVDNLN